MPIILGICTYLIKLDKNLLYLFAASFVYGSFFLGPDLDMANRLKLFSIRGFFTLPFRPYATLFHRRGISRSLLFGTISRIIYIGVILSVICYTLDKSYLNTKNLYIFLNKYQANLLTICLGLFLADFFHILLERLTPKRKTR